MVASEWWKQIRLRVDPDRLIFCGHICSQICSQVSDVMWTTPQLPRGDIYLLSRLYIILMCLRWQTDETLSEMHPVLVSTETAAILFDYVVYAAFSLYVYHICHWYEASLDSLRRGVTTALAYIWFFWGSFCVRRAQVLWKIKNKNTKVIFHNEYL